MALSDVKTALLTVTSKCYHYTAPQTAAVPYIVWAEDNQSDSVHADDAMQEQAIQGTIDYYTKTENDPNVEKIQEALNSAEISYRINSIQYEKDTGYIHFEWVFEVDAWLG